MVPSIAALAKSVGIVVLRSGKDKKDEWVTEERDPVADYRQIFGKQPEMISGLAIMVDTDNTSQDNISWFDDFYLEVSDPAKDVVRPKPLFIPPGN